MNSLIPQGQEFSPQNMIEKAKRTLDGGYLVQIFYGDEEVYAEMFHHAIEIGTNDALQDFAVNITYNGKTVPLTKQFPTEKILNIIIGDHTEVDQVSTEDAVNLFLLRG